jgi:hypothetical protein
LNCGGFGSLLSFSTFWGTSSHRTLLRKAVDQDTPKCGSLSPPRPIVKPH